MHSSLSDDRGGGGGGEGGFVTSTPKSGKENLVQSERSEAWSPTILLSKRRRLLKETNEVSVEYLKIQKKKKIQIQKKINFFPPS